MIDRFFGKPPLPSKLLDCFIINKDNKVRLIGDI